MSALSKTYLELSVNARLKYIDYLLEKDIEHNINNLTKWKETQTK